MQSKLQGEFRFQLLLSAAGLGLAAGRAGQQDLVTILLETGQLLRECTVTVETKPTRKVPTMHYRHAPPFLLRRRKFHLPGEGALPHL